MVDWELAELAIIDVFSIQDSQVEINILFDRIEVAFVVELGYSTCRQIGGGASYPGQNQKDSQ